jgi:membrane associated rhomboid family serine protease
MSRPEVTASVVSKVQQRLTIISFVRAIAIGLAALVITTFLFNVLLPFLIPSQPDSLGIWAGVVGTMAGIAAGIFSRRRDGVV